MVLLKVFLAQLEERQPSKLNVSGSNPLEYDRVQRSLVAYLFWVQVVAGSNPATLNYHYVIQPKNFKILMNCISFLTCSLLLFLLGIWGIFFNRKNIVVMLMCIELMLLAVNLNFLIFSTYLDDLIGQLFSLLILTVAAAESAIGLALLVIY